MIMHVDGDGFFAACEMARFPHLRGKPVVVGGDRGIACAMSYEAKALGIHRAMPIFKIKREFPEVIILNSHFELYHMYSEKLYRVLCRFTTEVEHYSIDECFAVLTEEHKNKYGSWEALLRAIKISVQNELGITFSFGLADTKVLAKVASKLQKPDGCTVLYSDRVNDTLRNVPIGAIWGVGWRLSAQFQNRRWLTAFDFAKQTQKTIEGFAKPIQELWHELHGRSVLPVTRNTDNHRPKSLQAVRTFSPASNIKEYIFSEFSRNVEIITERLRNEGLYAGSVSLFFKFGLRGYRYTVRRFEEHSNNPSDFLAWLTDDMEDLYDKGILYRATGITVMDLRTREELQYDFFGKQERVVEQGKLLEAVDTIREKYGTTSISLLSSLTSIQKRRDARDEENKKDAYVWNLPLPYLGEIN